MELLYLILSCVLLLVTVDSAPQFSEFRRFSFSNYSSMIRQSTAHQISSECTASISHFSSAALPLQSAIYGRSRIVLRAGMLLHAAPSSMRSANDVPYDYVPYGRSARRDAAAGHPHDVNLNYERLFPARRKYIDSPAVHIEPDFDSFKK